MLRYVSCFVITLVITSYSPAQDAKRDAANKDIEKRAAEIEKFLSGTPCRIGKPISDREAWKTLGEKPEFKDAVATARDLAKTSIPELPESLYKEFYQNGNRSRYQKVRGIKYKRIADLVLAECIENRGNFITPIEEIIRSVCNDRSWSLPAHDGGAAIYDGKTVYIDLSSSDTSLELALAVSWLGEKLSPEIRKLVAENVERRTFEPYEKNLRTGKPEMFWVMGSNNWNAVCHANVVGAAQILIDSPRRRAWYIATSEHCMNYFLKGFSPDGYCSEGMGYWNYGFGHFTDLSEIVNQATGGKVDFFDSMPRSRNCALFGPRMEVAPEQFAAFADCSISARPSPVLVGYLSRRFRFGYTEYEKAVQGPGTLKAVAVYAFPNSVASIPAAPTAKTPLEDLRTEFPDAGILICRPGAGKTGQLAMACKGGHNAEHHNHNDVGSFSVTYAGTLPVLDPGGEVYTRRTFSGKRYDSKLLNSFGHPVPVINGQLQKTGRKAEGKIVSKSFTDDKDVYVLDYASAYSLKELRKLQRTFVFNRTPKGTPNSITVTDEFRLDPAGTFESALETYEPWQRLDSDVKKGTVELLIGKKGAQVRVSVTATSDGTPVNLDFASTEIDEDAMAGKKPTRFGFNITSPVASAKVEITIRPMEAK